MIRTRGLYVPNVALYQTEPHLDWSLTKQIYYALAPFKSQAKTVRREKEPGKALSKMTKMILHVYKVLDYKLRFT